MRVTRVILSLNLIACGCETVDRTVEAGGEGARKVIGGIEPTGIVKETQERQEAWGAIRLKVDQVDIGQFNETVADFRNLVQGLTQRLEVLPMEEFASANRSVAASAAALQQQIESLRLNEAVQSVEALGQTLNQKAAELDVTGFNALAGELQSVAEEFRRLGQTIAQDTTVLARAAAERLHGLPPEQLRATLARLNAAAVSIDRVAEQLPQTAQKFDSALGSARFGFRATSAMALLASACMGLWLFKSWRPR
jgi:hypothetical protein